MPLSALDRRILIGGFRPSDTDDSLALSQGGRHTHQQGFLALWGMWRGHTARRAKRGRNPLTTFPMQSNASSHPRSATYSPFARPQSGQSGGGTVGPVTQCNDRTTRRKPPGRGFAHDLIGLSGPRRRIMGRPDADTSYASRTHPARVSLRRPYGRSRGPSFPSTLRAVNTRRRRARLVPIERGGGRA